ncbi:MAG: cadmium-translocating P-type ATPase [Chloroflexota bacterium]|nr:cadmium-translocating P-type ATPase [Chloroflexota bacterium]
MAQPLAPPIPQSTPRPVSAPFNLRQFVSAYGLVALAALTWALAISAFVLDRATGTSQDVIVGLYAASYLTGGTLALKAAITDLLDGVVNVDLLMVTAAAGAAVIGAWGEGAVLLALFSSSNALEHFAMDRTRDAVRALMQLAPESAVVLHGDDEIVTPIGDVAVGDLVLVRPGERVPVDGRVESGHSEVDQATITGESTPVAKGAGDTVFAGTINGHGILRVTVAKHASESTLARIVRVVSDAREQQGRTQRFAEAFEGKYAIGVILFSTLVFLIPWLLLDQNRSDAFYRAMTILVVMSPCALVISTPASTLSALANAARHGILFKGGAYLEAAGRIPTIAFDKTGTLTKGEPSLTDILPLDPALSEDRLLQIAASVERFSEHHISHAVGRAVSQRGLELVPAHRFKAIPGQGVTAEVEGQTWRIGNRTLLQSLGIDGEVEDARAQELLTEGKTVVYVVADERIAGLLAIADEIRPEAADVVSRLKRVGVRDVVMITGDNERVAREIAGQVGITDVHADVLPEAKMGIITGLKERGGVAMVGDGVNDAPALAIADLGIAMGGGGTDVALETADMVLMTDDLNGVAYAIELSRRTHRIIIQNLAFSLGVIVVLAIAALTVGIPLPLGVVGHEGSTVIVVLNGLRLLVWGRN